MTDRHGSICLVLYNFDRCLLFAIHACVHVCCAQNYPGSGFMFRVVRHASVMNDNGMLHHWVVDLTHKAYQGFMFFRNVNNRSTESPIPYNYILYIYRYNYISDTWVVGVLNSLILFPCGISIHLCNPSFRKLNPIYY